MDFLKLLSNKDFISGWVIKDFRLADDEIFYKIEIKIINDSKLFAKDYIGNESRSYSFHWQDSNNQLIIRWDNAPHHKEIHTFPHHKHLPNTVEESAEMTLTEVLGFIEKYLRGKDL